MDDDAGKFYTLEEIMADLAVVRADTYDKKRELILQQLTKLHDEGSPEPKTGEAFFKLYEAAGVENSYHYPLFIEAYGREVQYSRVLFDIELQYIMKSVSTLDRNERNRKAIALAKARGVTSQIAYKWHCEELLLNGNDYVEDNEPDFEHYMGLQFLHDLEAVMFMNVFCSEK